MGEKDKLLQYIFVYLQMDTHNLQLCFGQRGRADCVLILHLQLKYRSCSISVQPPSRQR